MVLETLNPSLNIKKLSVEPPQPVGQKTFDPSEDIYDSDWSLIEKKLRISIGEPYDSCRLAVQLKVVDSQRFQGLGIGADLRSRILFSHQMFRSTASGSDWIKVLHRTADFKLLDPEGFNELYENPGDQESDMKNIAGQLRKDHHRLHYAVDYTLVSSGRDSEVYPDEDFEELKSRFIFQRKPSIGSGFNLAEHARNIRLLFPERYDELVLTNDDWKKMRNVLFSMRPYLNTGIKTFVDMASYMYILAAEKAEITQKGLEVIFKTPQFDSGHPQSPLPERRRF